MPTLTILTKPSATGVLPLLTKTEPQAIALGYVHNAAKANAKKYPAFQEGQNCRSCALFAGNQVAERAQCFVMTNRVVKAEGWCSAYAKRSY